MREKKRSEEKTLSQLITKGVERSHKKVGKWKRGRLAGLGEKRWGGGSEGNERSTDRVPRNASISGELSGGKGADQNVREPKQLQNGNRVGKGYRAK